MLLSYSLLFIFCQVQGSRKIYNFINSVFRSRDKNYTKERPRSWHASKYIEIDHRSANSSTSSVASGYRENAHDMRSPSSDHNSQNRQYKNSYDNIKARRRSKGWQETEDLKSTVKGRFNDSKDSLISGGESCHVSRHSVSSSRSSGTMSSSRGSLDNLLSNNHSRKNSDNLVNDNRSYINKKSPDHNIVKADPYHSNVGSKKHLFEQLSTSSDGVSSRSSASKENIYRPTHRNSKEDLPKYHRSSNPSDSKSGRSSRTSLSPPRSVGDSTGHGRQTSLSSKESQHSDESFANSGMSPPQQRLLNRLSPPPLQSKGTGNTDYYSSAIADAKVVKQTYDVTRGVVNEEVTYSPGSAPQPPTRNTSSSLAVHGYSKQNQVCEKSF